MKKILFIIASFITISFISCGNRTNNSYYDLDTEDLYVDTILIDTFCDDFIIPETVNVYPIGMGPDNV